jgi:hypothetical protein
MSTNALSEIRKLLGKPQDNDRQWVTVVATSCVNGTPRSRGLIYESWQHHLSSHLAGNCQRWRLPRLPHILCRWTDERRARIRLVSERLRSGDEVEAKRDWKLLLLDGHIYGSHLTIRFLDWYESRNTLVAVYPSNSRSSSLPRPSDHSNRRYQSA